MHGHHKRHGADGGATDLDNLATLCVFHHMLVYKGGWRLNRLDQRWMFRRPGGRRFIPHRRALRQVVRRKIVEPVLAIITPSDTS